MKSEDKIRSNGDVDPELDQLIRRIGFVIEAENARPAIVNHAAVQKVRFTYALAKWLVKDMEDVRVTYTLHRPYKASGSVHIEAPRLDFLRTDLFMKLVRFVGNFDFYTKTNGTVCLDFGFSDFTTAISE